MANTSMAVIHLQSQLRTRFDALFEVRKGMERKQLPTGIPAIDKLTSGGIPRGTLTEICGTESTGRTALVFALLSQASRHGECCAWVDTAGAFDPVSAVEAGVDLDRVLWVNCGGNAQHALKAADLLIQAGGFGLVVLDMADTPDAMARRIPLASWFRLRHAAERTDAALVAVERQINARSCSTLQIEMRIKKPLWIGKLLRGMMAQAESRKHFKSQVTEFSAVR
jgi:recombination protein RecA